MLHVPIFVLIDCGGSSYYSRFKKAILRECRMQVIKLSRLLFVDVALLFVEGSIREWRDLKSFLYLFSLLTRMDFSLGKSMFLCNFIPSKVEVRIGQLFPFGMVPIDNGLKYLAFQLKHNDNRVADWIWNVEQVEDKINCWCYKWILIVGRLVLVKAFLQIILVY